MACWVVTALTFETSGAAFFSVPIRFDPNFVFTATVVLGPKLAGERFNGQIENAGPLRPLTFDQSNVTAFLVGFV